MAALSKQEQTYPSNCSKRLLKLLEEAFDELTECLAEVGEILDQPALDRGRLTTVRLKVAQLRLNRAVLINDVVGYLQKSVSQKDVDILHDLKKGNEELLAVASAHTTKWDLTTIAENWEEYRSVSRDLVSAWLEKMRWEQATLNPLLQDRS